MKRGAVLVVVAMALGGVPALAQAPKDNPAAGQSAARTYLREAAIADLFGVELSKLALDRAQEQAVRQIAGRIVANRTDGLSKLRNLASSAQLDVPISLDKANENKLDELRKIEGAEFDRAYLDLQLKTLETTLALHAAYALTAQDGPLRSYASETSATLERQVEQLRQAGGAATRS